MFGLNNVATQMPTLLNANFIKRETIMKKLFLVVGMLFGVALFATDAKPKNIYTAINVSNRRPIEAPNYTMLRSYANSGNYYLSVQLHDGMKVSFSASYGVGGEAAQARGTLVQQDGRFYFRQDANPSMNLLLPPGLPLNAGTDVSLWDVGAYMELINRVAFSQSNMASSSENDVYSKPQAYLVDFDGGTAGSTVKYSDAMEVDFNKSLESGANSNFQAYYAKGVGPVALEFQENSEPQGTFKFYLGQ